MNAPARSVLRVAIVLAALVSLGDVASVRMENPRSFDGLTDLLGLLAPAFVLAVVVTVLGAVVVLLVSRPFGYDPGRAVVVLGLAAWLFAWASVRVHVHWLFGEPLVSVRSLLASAVVLGVSVTAAVLVGRWSARGWEWVARSRWIVVLGAIGMAPGLFLAWTTSGSESEPPPTSGSPALRDVLLVTLDTTRADHLSSFGYPRGTSPNLDRLARTATWVGTLVTPVPLTNPSHVSLLTGLSPRDHGVLNNGTPLAPDADTVTRRLSARGMRCAAFVSGIPLKKAWSGLGPGFERYDDSFSRLEPIHPMLTSLTLVRVAARIFPIDLLERRGASTAAAACDWLRSTPGPRFAWVHFFDPHTPYRAPRILQDRFACESSAWTHRDVPVTDWPTADYDAELRYVDAALGTVLREFHEVTEGEGVVVVVGDHGEGLYDHGELTHGSQLYDEDIRVPVIIASGEHAPPTLSPEIVGSTTVLADVILGLAEGVPPTWRRPELVTSETFPPEGHRRQTALLMGSEGGIVARKLIVDWSAGTESRFDLEVDPGEARSATDSPEWGELRRRIAAPSDLEAINALDAETVRKLRALGYVH